MMLMKLEPDRKEYGKSYYLIIALIGVLLSIFWCKLIKTEPFSDFKYYYELARSISQGKPWGDTYTTVGYPIVLGGIFKVFGDSLFIAKTFNLILILLNYYLAYSILNKLDVKEKLRKVIFTIFIFFPLNIMYSSVLATEPLFTTILLLITNIYFSKTKFKYIYIGILTAMNAMIKPFFIIFFFAILIIDAIGEWNIKKAIINSLTVLIISLLCISPWIYRNTKYVGELTFISNNGGIVLYINNNSQNKTGMWMDVNDVENSVAKTEEYKNANMTQKNKMLTKAAKKWIKDNPKRFVELGLLRLGVTYGLADDTYYTTYGSDVNASAKYNICKSITGVKACIFLVGIIFALLYSIYIIVDIFKNRGRNIDKGLLYTLVTFYMFTCVYFITEGQGRYSFPLIFFMIYLSATCIEHLFRLRNKSL
ncbi:hypothetical protein DP130_09640 [Clostridium tetani]|uniref:Uncharacterized protein n=2 Tax=Clostridium tetani TaxID=1513 RepID=A0A4Q0VA78_CLOTA|nr:hypothetical protein DP130_09640 [Clostridium tetani]